MGELFLVPFDYDIQRADRRGRPGTTALRRATAAIEIATVRAADLPVAYRIMAVDDMGRRWHPIRRHDGKLWWPLVERTFRQQIKPAREFLHELRAGRCDLFVRRGLDHPFYEFPRCRRVVHDGHDDALAAVQRNARDLLIVDDALYAAGGAPLLIEAHDGIRIASVGADRAVTAPAGALRIKPANGHWPGRDHAICADRFYVPRSFKLESARSRGRYGLHGVHVETCGGAAVDPVVVRIDAAFKVARTALNKSIPRTRPEGWEALRAQFIEACAAAEDDYLTATRHRALRRFVELFAAAERKPVAVSECLYQVQRTVSATADLPRVLGPELAMTADDETALASLVA